MSGAAAGAGGLSPLPQTGRTYAMLVKPVSGACNLRCGYCYYTGKERLLDVGVAVMSPDVLEAFTRQNFAMHGKDAVVEFAWHGGEPTLAGVGFFREAVRLQEKYGRGRRLLNTLQTNGTLLDDEFCAFFRENRFLIGVSVDGPSDCHNAYRRTPYGGGSFDMTMRGVELLRKHGVPFNTLTAVNDVNSLRPVETYRFLRELTDYVQFLPVVERLPAPYEAEEGYPLAAPPGIHFSGSGDTVTPFSVLPGAYGDFLCAVLDEWRRQDSGRKHVQLIDVTLGNLKGVASPLCVHNPLCGHSGCVEANGDVYACDRYAFPAYRLGNIMEADMGALMEQNRRFGMHKAYGLPEECFDCPYIKLCFGGCPKDRLINGRNYLCEGYKLFFAAVRALV